MFSNLMGNAIDATNGNGRVTVSSREKDSAVEVAFGDNGRGLNPQEIRDYLRSGFSRSAMAGWQAETGYVQLAADRSRAWR